MSCDCFARISVCPKCRSPKGNTVSTVEQVGYAATAYPDGFGKNREDVQGSEPLEFCCGAAGCGFRGLLQATFDLDEEEMETVEQRFWDAR